MLSRTSLAIVFGLLQLSLIASSSGIPGYIFTADKSASTNTLEGAPIYNDNDVKNLFLHNLGLLDNHNQVPSSAKDLISQVGTKSLFSPQKMNVAFLLEGKSSEPILAGSTLKHQAAVFNICAEDEQNCLINHLFDQGDKQSVISKLQTASGKKNVEAYFYSTESRVVPSSAEASLTQVTNKQGNVFIVDHNSNSQFKIASSLELCVNDVLKGKFEVNMTEGSITSVRSEETVTVPQDAQKEFTQFMTDICSIWGVSTLIRKDPNPSFFVFHIESLGQLEQVFSAEDSKMLYKVFSVVYDKFMKQVMKHYNAGEISGQVFVLSPENHIDNTTTTQFAQISEKFARARQLDETDTSSTGAVATNPTTLIIFKSVLVIFVLVTAYVCLEMFNIDIQKDSVVYAKFLAADYFRR